MVKRKKKRKRKLRVRKKTFRNKVSPGQRERREKLKPGSGLGSSKEFLEKLVQNSMEALISSDLNGNIILFNRAAEELTGYKAEEVIGKKNIVDLYAPGTARSLMKKLRSPLYGGVGRLETTHSVLISKRGEEIPVNMNAVMIYDDAGNEVASVGFYQDLRERIEIEKRLRRAQERLLESKRREAVMALAGAAGHELNQPLTSIMGYMEILKNLGARLKEQKGFPENLLASFQNAIKVIMEQAERMASSVKKLSELSEFETREYAGKEKILDLEKSGQRERTLAHCLEMIEEAILVIDQEQLILRAFGKSREVFEENPEGRSLSRYFEGVNYARIVELMEQANRKGMAQEELVLHSANGQNKRIKLTIEPGENQELILSIMEVGARRQMEAQLQELVAFREELFQNLPVPLLVMDQDGKISYLTREAERLFGYQTQELKGKLPEQLLEGFNYNQFLQMLRKLRAQGKLEGKTWARDRSERRFLIYYFSRVMRNSAGELIGYLFFLVDLSEKQFLEQALQEKTNYLEALQKNTEILLRGTDWQEAMTAMLAQLRRVLDFDLAGVIPIEPTERGIYFLRYYPESQEKHLQEIKLYEHLDFALKLLTRPETIYREEFNENTFSELPGDLEGVKKDLLQRGIRSFMVVPLKVQEELVGSLFVGHHTSGFFKPGTVERVQQIIDQLAIALSQFRLYMKLEKQSQNLLQRNLFLEQIIEQSQKIELSQEESQIFAQFLNLLQGIFPRAHLWLAWREDQGEFLVKGVSNLDPGLIGTRLNLKRELEESFLQTGHPFAFEPGVAEVGFLEEAQSIILTPIISGKKLLGLLGLESHHKEPFLAEEKFLFQLFSRYLAMIIPNLLRIRQATLFSNLQEILIENSSMYIIMYDQEGKIALLNQAICNKLGRKKEELLGMGIQEFSQKYLLRIEDQEGRGISSVDELFQRMSRGERFLTTRIKFRTELGQIVDAISSTDAVRDSFGNLHGIIIIAQDLSPMKEMEAKLIHSERLAGIGQMATGIAHELNNPLQAIITSSELIKRRLEELGEKTMAHRAEITIQAGERIQRLAKSLMSYARPSPEVPQEIELKKLVDEILSFSGYELRRHGVEIENLVPENLPKFKAVKDQIEQVLLNLLTNAAYACAEKSGGRVKIKARARGSRLELRVEDNGIGIPPENLSRIFEPFFTTKPREKGTGLGLNIVQAIVERHQGKIRVRSKPGEGTVFTILLPYQSSELLPK